MSLIHILNGQSDAILDVITSPNIISNNHRQSLEDTLETFVFTTFADKRFSEFVIGENYVIIPNEDEGYSEFVINEVDKYRDSEGLKIEAYSSASYLMLKKAKVIKPTTLTEYTPSMLVGWTINDTEWRVGAIEGAGYRTLTIDTHTNPFAFLKRIAREFELELRFRVETDGNRVIGRYVDLLERVGKWRGREVEFGRDLIGIRRNEKTDNIYTALIGLGPEDEEGNRLEVLVEDEEALQRWGRPNEQGVLKHLIGTYEPQSTRANMTESELRQYTRTELDKRINEVVTYETTIADLENVPGMQNKKIRYGDTIKIKDTKFNPPLYLEARVFEQDRDIKIQGQKKVKLGDYTEYTEEEVTAIWQQLQAEIRQKLSQRDLIEYTYSKVEIDTKDEYVFDEGKSFAEAVGIEAQEYAEEQDGFVRTDAQGYANNARDEAQAYAVAQDADVRQYAEDKSNEALQQALAETVAQEAYDFQMQSIADELADRTTIEYVDGRLVDKANVGDVYTIEQLDNRFNNYVGITQYTTDMDGIVTDLTDYGTRIGQNEEAIGLQANRIQAVEGTVSDHSAEFLVMADEISSKVDSTYVDGAIDGLEIGGRNLALGTKDDDWVAYSGSPTITRREGLNTKIIRVESISTTTFGVEQRSQFRKMNLEQGETYTLSFYVRGTKNLNYAYIMNNGDSNNSLPNITVPSSTDFTKVSIQFTGTSRMSNANGSFLMLSTRSGVSSTDWFEFYEVKIEKGNKATDWTPAPEDVQSEIDAVYSYASSEFEQLAGSIALKADATYVDGVESRITTAELEINALDGQIQSKVEENDVRSIFTQEADSFTFQADQINFDGHVFGEDATFSGEISTETNARVGNDLYIGNESDMFQKSIIFNSGTRIDSNASTLNIHTGNFGMDLDYGAHFYISMGVETPFAIENNRVIIHGGEASSIISQGSNENGEYIQYSNGLQICWHYISSLSVSTSTHLDGGNTIYRGGSTWTFPVSFIDIPVVNYDGDIGGGSTHATMKRFWSLTTSSAGLQFMGFRDFSTINRVSYFVIGRWK